MNAKEKILAALRREEVDIIPFTMYIETLHLAGLAIYEPWRKLLDNGLGIHGAFMHLLASVPTILKTVNKYPIT